MVRDPPTQGEKPVHWMGTSKSDLLNLPADVVSEVGYALGVAQLGGKHPAAKPWKGEGAGVFEFIERSEGNTYRAQRARQANMANDIIEGIGNVFADLGLSDPADRQTKTRLAMAVNAIVKERHLKQTDAAAILGIAQSKVSALANYRLDQFSVEKLMRFLNALNQDVEIVIRPSREDTGHTSVFALR